MGHFAKYMSMKKTKKGVTLVSLLKKVEKRWLVKPVERDAVLVELPHVSGKCVGCKNCEIAC